MAWFGKDRNIEKSTLIEGSQKTIDEHNERLLDDPVTGTLGELGFGTQVLPVSGADIQDEKVLGTCHLATGRDDHLFGLMVETLGLQTLRILDFRHIYEQLSSRA